MNRLKKKEPGPRWVRVASCSILLISSIGATKQAAIPQAAPAKRVKPAPVPIKTPLPQAVTRRPDLGIGPPSGELDLPDPLWPGFMQRYWLDHSPDATVVFQRLMAKANQGLPARAQQSCASWFSPNTSKPTIGTLLFIHLFKTAPGAELEPSRIGYLCAPSSPERWSCRVDRFSKNDDHTPTASLHVDLLAEKQVLLLDTLHCSTSAELQPQTSTTHAP